MSVLPICTTISRHANNPIRKSKDVVGTANAPIGYKLQQQVRNTKRQQHQQYQQKEQNPQHQQHQPNQQKEQNQQHQQHQHEDTNRSGAQSAPETVRNPIPKSTGTSIIPMSDERANDEVSRIEERELQNFIKTLEFVQRTDKMITLNKIREFVEEGMMAHEEDINIRREKLRHMLAEEDSELMRQVVNQVQYIDDARRHEIRARDEMKKRANEVKRMQLITSKRQQQHLENCPEARDRISRDITRGVKYSNLIQMLEKETHRQEDRKLDELWYKIMLRENEIQMARDNDEKRQRMTAGKATGLILKQQIAERSSSFGQVQRLREQEKLELEHLWNEVRAEEVEKLAHEREKRERFKRELEEQLMLAKRRMAEQTRQQAEVERMLKVANDEELRKEREVMAKTAEYLRNEMMEYMRSLEDLRAMEVRREAEVNAIIEESVKDAQARRGLASKRYREGRKRILEDFLVQRDEQLQLKRGRERDERQRREVEEHLLRKDAEAGATDGQAEAIKRREMAVQYGQQLQAQRQYDMDRRRREAERDRMMHCMALKENEEYVKFTEEMVNAPEIITPSAFKIMLKEYAARRCDAQQKSLCGQGLSLPSLPMSRSPLSLGCTD